MAGSSVQDVGPADWLSKQLMSCFTTKPNRERTGGGGVAWSLLVLAYYFYYYYYNILQDLNFSDLRACVCLPEIA